jgi:hypothetical protein
MRTNIIGRIVGGLLIGGALFWVLQMAGALNWTDNRTANQLVPDQPPIQDPNAFAAGVPANAQPLNTNRQPVQELQSGGTPIAQNNDPLPPADTAQVPAGGSGSSAASGGSNRGSSGAAAPAASTPVVRAGW